MLRKNHKDVAVIYSLLKRPRPNVGLDLLGIHTPSRPPSPWWYHRTLPQGPGKQVQLREDDL